jgi:serine/threonine protein kinase
MQVIAPVRDSTGSILGALAFSLRPEEEFTGVLSVARPGHSGETFAFDAGGLLISQSRFDETLQEWGLLTNSPGATSALSLELRNPGLDLRHHPVPETSRELWPLIPMVAAALSGTNGVSIVPSLDYRGVPTVGAWRWLPDRRFGVVTKIDADEVFQPLRVIERIFGGLLGLLALASVGFVSFSQLNFRWRRRFQEAQLKARRLGQYTLDEKIGEGCMGVVYRAHHALLRRHTAIKLLLPHQADALLIRQFEHEVRLTCQLSHPNTIQVYDYGHTRDGIFYYAMELLQGLTLQELVERTGAQPEARVLHFLAQICGSLQEAHAAGLIHRDIKPGNLFVCQRGGIPDTIKVLDFGLVQRLPDHPHSISKPEPDSDPAPDHSRFLGTPLYLAPESIRTPGFGNPQTDLYAVGAVGYFLLCGLPVFQCDDLESLWDHHLNVAPLPPGQRTPLPISHETESAILACLEKDPARRPASVTAFLAQLQRSPLFGTWNSELLQAWWSGPGRCLSTPFTPSPSPSTPAVPVATLRIDLDQR